MNFPPPIPIDYTSDAFVTAFDELPLWSAPFGLKLLEWITLRDGIDVLDVGCGCGFPAIEIAQRMGRRCRVYGIDPWPAALSRACRKAGAMQLSNVEFIEGEAEFLPFANDRFGLIVSNNGLNNVRDQETALRECARVTARDGQLVLTVNLPGTMSAFYAEFERSLRRMAMSNRVETLHAHIFEKRKPISHMKELLERTGWKVHAVDEGMFSMRYVDGSTMLRHFFIRAAFLPSWTALVPEERRTEFFGGLESALNAEAARAGGLVMEIPFVCIDTRRR